MHRTPRGFTGHATCPSCDAVTAHVVTGAVRLVEHVHQSASCLRVDGAACGTCGVCDQSYVLPVRS